jgi:hypothetical protein
MMSKPKINYWYDPYYLKQIEVYKNQIAELNAKILDAKQQLAQFDLERPEAKTARASGNIGGISLYFSGTITRNKMVFQLREKQTTIRGLKNKLREYKELLERSKQPL